MAGKREQQRRRGNRRADRQERRREANKGGGEWEAIRIPEGVEVFKPEDGKTYTIDILPYIAGDYNPAADKGDEYFELTYYVYNNLGVEDKRYIAIGETLGAKDPVAEHFAHLRKTVDDWDLMKPFKPSKRQLMLIFVHEQADKGLQLYEGAYGTFGEKLAEEIDDGGEETWVENLDDPEHGATVTARFKGRDIGQKNKWIMASKVDLDEREDGFTANGDKKLAAEVLAKASEICLDDLLKIPTYETLKKALDGEPIKDGDEDAEPPPPTTGRRRGKAKDPDPEPEPDPEDEPQATAADLGISKGMEVTHPEYGECTVIRVAKDGLTISLMDEDDEVHKGIDPAEVKQPGEDTPAEPPAKGAGKKSGSTKASGAKSAGKKKSPSKPDPEDGDEDEGGSDEGGDDWDDDWDD